MSWEDEGFELFGEGSQDRYIKTSFNSSKVLLEQGRIFP